jgi:hypothetical protein
MTTNPADSAAAAFRTPVSHWRRRRPGGPTAPIRPTRPQPIAVISGSSQPSTCAGSAPLSEWLS